MDTSRFSIWKMWIRTSVVVMVYGARMRALIVIQLKQIALYSILLLSLKDLGFPGLFSGKKTGVSHNREPRSFTAYSGTAQRNVAVTERFPPRISTLQLPVPTHPPPDHPVKV